MTYCLAIKVDQGLVLASDSRTNAGPDQVSTFSKMHSLEVPGDRVVCLLTAGNLATTQAVLRRIRRDNEAELKRSIGRFTELADAAEYIGAISRAEQKKHGSGGKDGFSPEASFILGGQLKGRQPQIYQIYAEGNYIAAGTHTPYLQIGELKYGKPILDRIIRPDLSLEVAARCALVSMDSTMRSNATVGPPIELKLYSADSLRLGRRLVLAEDNDYLRALRASWQAGLQQAFEQLPSLPLSRPTVQLVDAQADS